MTKRFAGWGVVGVLAVLPFGVLEACTSTATDAAISENPLRSAEVQVLTQHNDRGRTGANLKERQLSVANVNTHRFGKLFTRTVDGQIYAQPLYVGGVGGRNVVYVATEHNSVYAFDADKPSESQPLWRVNLGPSAPSSDTSCRTITPEIGITSTPVIDLAASTIFVSAETKEGSKFVHRLHALDLATGQEKANSPVEMKATAPGTGAGSVGGVLTLDPSHHLNRPALLQQNGTIYVGFGSNCDYSPYHGWVLAYDATTLRQTGVHVDTPNGDMGGIWHGAVGLNGDDNGNVYYASGNGDFDGQKNFGNSIVRLRSPANGQLPVGSFFTPYDSKDLNKGDLDIGSTGAMLIPGTQLLVAGGKAGVLYLVDRENMGGIADQDQQIRQRLDATEGGMFGGMAYYPRTSGGLLYVWGARDRLKAFPFDGARLATTPLVNPNALTGFPGGQISVSADGTVPGTAIVWTLRSTQTMSALGRPGPAMLQAFDANDITHELWNSGQAGADAVGTLAKFSAPVIANGKVYVGTVSNELVIYGLRGGS